METYATRAATLPHGALAFRGFKLQPGALAYRKVALDLDTFDKKIGTVDVTLSSETVVRQPWGHELLEHSESAVNMVRTKDGLIALANHDPTAIIGRFENVRLVDRRLKATLRFSRNPLGQEAQRDVEDGIRRDVSIGYSIDQYTEDGDAIHVTAWTPAEGSLVAFGADHTVGIDRAAADMPAFATRAEDDTPRLVIGNDPATLAKQRQRRQEIRQLGQVFAGRGVEFQAIMDKALDDDRVSLEAFRRQLLDTLSNDAQPIAHDLIQAPGSANGRFEQAGTTYNTAGRRFEFMHDRSDGFPAAARDATLLRAGIIKPEDAAPGALDLRDKRLPDILTMTLELGGVNVLGMSMCKRVAEGFARRSIIAHSTADFPSITEDVSSKALGIGYNEAPETWQAWCRIVSIPDFKQANFPNISAFGDLEIVYEDGEFKYGTFSDKKETLQLATYGKLFSISRQTIVNDDLNAFARVPNGMGRAAARTVGDLPYNVLINGITTTMNEDAKALFHSDHNNYVAPGSGAAPSVSTLDSAWSSMATQTDPSGAAVLNIVPRFWIGPRSLENTAVALAVSRTDPAGSTINAVNPFAERFTVIADARLDAADTLAWYLAGDPGQVDTVGVGFLDGQQTPFLETQNGWSVDGVAFKVRIDAAAAPLDYRGLYKNDGN
jgi:hypothetical protein